MPPFAAYANRLTVGEKKICKFYMEYFTNKSNAYVMRQGKLFFNSILLIIQ